MQRIMQAKYAGRCAVSGAAIYPGDTIKFDTSTRKAWLCEHDDAGVYIAQRTATKPGYVSDVFRFGNNEFYRNKAGRCEDAPCCGCCTI